MTGAITALLLCQLAGEVLSRVLHLPVPGPVLGMLLLFVILLARGRLSPQGEQPPEALARVSDTLLSQLGLLFVPAGVGVIALLHTMADNGWALLLAAGLGTPLTMALTGRLAQAVLRRWG
jgi:holin-like protein